MKFSSAAVSLCLMASSVATCSAAIAKAPDLAAVFVGKLLAGEIAEAKPMMAGLVGQAGVWPVVEGKVAVDSAEFLSAVGDCRINDIRNLSPASDFQDFASDFLVVWDCKGLGLKARVSSSEGWVRVSDFGKVVFAPPSPPKPSSNDGKQ